MSRLMLKSAKRASLIENLRSLRGLGKMRVRRSGSCLANGERRLEKWKLLVSLEAPKALGGFLHGRACPTQSHRRRAPVFYVPADAPHRAHDILDDMFVQASERRSSGGSPSFVTVSISSSPSRIEAETPSQSFSRCRARLRRSVSALPASASSQACRNTRLTCACIDFGKRSMM